MKALGEYIHSRGLKFGIYSDAGYTTCGGRPGSRGYEYQDALTYASWGVDYLKHDWCDTDGLAARGAYMTMRDAIGKAGRPMVLSICEWGDNQPWEWAQDVGHLWRTTGDIYACFDCVVDHGTWKSWGVLQILDMQDGLRRHAGPGHWNDPDMMQVGNLASANEDRAHFAMWAMLAAPLIAGNDLRDMNPETLAILTNRDVIAVNQDPLGVQGFPFSREDGVEVWFKPLAEGDWAMAILNRNEHARDVDFDWSTPVVDPDFGHELRLHGRSTLRDLWTGTPARPLGDRLQVNVPGKDVALYRLSSSY
jgi:alpha-galactosidase